MSKEKFFTDTSECLNNEYKFVKGLNNINFEELNVACPEVRKKIVKEDNIIKFELYSTSYLQLKSYKSFLDILIQKAKEKASKIKELKKRNKEYDKKKKMKLAEKRIVDNINNIDNKIKEEINIESLLANNKFYGLNINQDCP